MDERIRAGILHLRIYSWHLEASSNQSVKNLTRTLKKCVDVGNGNFQITFSP